MKKVYPEKELNRGQVIALFQENGIIPFMPPIQTYAQNKSLAAPTCDAVIASLKAWMSKIEV